MEMLKEQGDRRSLKHVGLYQLGCLGIPGLEMKGTPAPISPLNRKFGGLGFKVQEFRVWVQAQGLIKAEGSWISTSTLHPQTQLLQP